MSNLPPMLPDEVTVSRSDPVYMAHGYLTKVPIAAIQPYIEAFTKPGDVVLDPFAGSGMTGVAAATCGRAARLSDVSVLGRHIGSNYVNLVSGPDLMAAAERTVKTVNGDLDDPYVTTCSLCGERAETVKVVVSIIVECGECGAENSFYEQLEGAGWKKPSMECHSCASPISARCRRVGERPELESVKCPCHKKQVDQEPSYPARDWASLGIPVPSAEIDSGRQMFVASALAKHDMTTTRSFFSDRNAAVLATLHREINLIADPTLRAKMMFAFTAILPRASKRYQWSKARPLNAANANYYVAPVFYEWNCFDLWLRKIQAVIKSDRYIEAERKRIGANHPVDVTYATASATDLPFEDGSIDYVFTDPPFGWNIFYSDMNLFQEAWLDGTTEASDEAVIDRSATSAAPRTAQRYEDMLAASLAECRRVLKPGGWITVVFGNSSGAVWEVVQRAIIKAGLAIDQRTIASLDKGQRSVKGLASGFENVATQDLILSLRPATSSDPADLITPTADQIATVVLSAMDETDSPSHLYVTLLKVGIANGWALGSIDLRIVTRALLDHGVDVDPKSGRFVREPVPQT